MWGELSMQPWANFARRGSSRRGGCLIKSKAKRRMRYTTYCSSPVHNKTIRQKIASPDAAAASRGGGRIGGQGIPNNPRVSWGHGVYLRRPEHWLGSDHRSPILLDPQRRAPGASGHVRSLHDGHSAGAPARGGTARPFHYIDALFSARGLFEQVAGRHGGRRDHEDQGVTIGEWKMEKVGSTTWGRPGAPGSRLQKGAGVRLNCTR